MRKKAGFIGAGNMAYAISSKMKEFQVYLYDVHPESYERFQERNAVGTHSIEELVDSCDIVFLSVKPQNFDQILTAIAAVKNHQHCIYVSIAAGISTAFIASKIGAQCRIVRVMPNTPLLLGSGCSALCRNDNVSEEEFHEIIGIFSNSGYTQVLPEEKMNDVIALSGSSPAYAYYFIEALVDGAVKDGFDPEVAKQMACATVAGSLKMILETEHSTSELIQMVCSKGGTTERAMNVLRERDFKGIILEAMKQCNDRAREMGR